jgi:parvulin-like peptidyl-prolyl isomerase
LARTRLRRKRHLRSCFSHPRGSARTFGDAFAKQLAAAEVGERQAPIGSSFGVHFVFIDERKMGSRPAPPELARKA